MSASQSNSATKPRLRVKRGVIGILRTGPRLLLVRRGLRVASAGFWCFPGGHLERGETAGMAIVRELREELGIEVRLAKRVGAVRLADRDYVLAVWAVRHLNGELSPSASEIAEMRWLTPAEIRMIHPSLPSNEVVLDLLGL